MSNIVHLVFVTFSLKNKQRIYKPIFAYEEHCRILTIAKRSVIYSRDNEGQTNLAKCDLSLLPYSPGGSTRRVVCLVGVFRDTRIVGRGCRKVNDGTIRKSDGGFL